MYIWILLATIMVAFSFYNLPPRADKANAITEIKATTVLNRFRIEHAAMVRTFECESVLNVDTLANEVGEGGWMSSHYFRIRKPIPTTCIKEPAENYDNNDTNENLDYISYAGNLPIGYAPDCLKVRHFIACFNNKIESKDSVAENCQSTKYRYLISYVPIPSRWISKKAYKPDGASVEYIYPLPTLSSLMVSEGFSGMFYGWTSCDGHAKCTLHGKSAVSRTRKKTDGENSGSEDEETNTQPKKNQYEYKSIDPDAEIWKSGETDDPYNFGSLCNSPASPCLFAYSRLSGSKTSVNCKALYKAKFGDQGGDQDEEQEGGE